MSRQIAPLLALFGALPLLLPVARAQEATPPPAAKAESFVGKVVAVADGDTIDVLRNGAQVRVRLIAVDAPEMRQAYGERAKQFASGLAFGKTVRVDVKDTDRYGRLLGVVTLVAGADTKAVGKELNAELVREGFGWWYSSYNPKDTKYGDLEVEARSEKRGLWKDQYPCPPWVFRHPESAAATGSKAKRSRAAAADAAPAPAPGGNDNAVPADTGAVSDGKVWVNTRSGVYWMPGTEFYGKTKQGKYLSEEEAKKAGYRPAKPVKQNTH